MRKITNLTAAVLIFTLLFTLTTAVSAYEHPPLLVDNSGILTSDEAERINSSLLSLSEEWNFDAVIVTTDSIGYKTAQEYADDYYDENGYGRDGEYSGILFLVSMEERDWALSTCGKGIYIFSDYDLDSMAEDILYYLSNGNYARAFETYISRVESRLETYSEADKNNGGSYSDGYNNNYNYSYESEYNNPEEMGTGTKVLISLTIGVIIGFIGVGIMKSNMKTIRYNSSASDYVVQNSLNVTRASEIYLYRNVSRTPRQTEQAKTHTSSRSGGSVHTSSSGRSHGGRSGKF